MPQASDELRSRMKERFGDAIGDSGPRRFLAHAGYQLLPSWTWEKPSPDHVVTPDEEECLRFLIDEWDFGGLAS